MKLFFANLIKMFISGWSRLDWKWHFMISDFFIFPVLFFVFRYRRKVVSTNLRAAFPSFSVNECKGIEKQFYKYLSDVFVETIKGFTISEEDLRSRVVFGPFPVLQTKSGQPQTCILLIGHLGNQELIAKSLPFAVDMLVKIPFRKIKQSFLERLVNNARSQFGALLFPAEKPAFFLRGNQNPFLLALAADQAANPIKSFWIPFFGRETTFFKGPEKWANWLDCPVVYAHVARPKRGTYKIDFHLISDNPTSLNTMELTRVYARLLEENIKQDPAIWLWSHRRWKHVR